ncbi:MAG: hypothetical protein ACOVN2_03120 [Usitatibacteraceae bacterium]|jgi:hypothetical protein
MIKYVLALLLLTQFGTAALLLAFFGQIGWISAGLMATGCFVVFKEVANIADRRYQAGEI